MNTRNATPRKAPVKWGARALKWVAAATAVVSLVIAVQQVTSWAMAYVRGSREASTLIEVARQQAARQEYSQAWASLERAAALRDDDGLESARLAVAFAWLQEARPGPGNPFSTITDAVTPALDRALVTAQGARRADILAHLGWAAFLRQRNDGSGDPASRYQEALAIDPGNVFANAMLGHWLLWKGSAIADARSRFDTALAAGRERASARRFQLAAVINSGQRGDVELLRVVNEMRKGGEPLDARSADRLYWLYTMWYRSNAAAGPDASLPAADIAATFDYLLRTSKTAEGSPQVQRIQEALRNREAR